MLRDLPIRPLTAADADRVQAFVRGLSPQARASRYFSPIRELGPRELERTTQPGTGAASLAAFDREAIAGLAEYANAEFGIVVGDVWQGFGLGRRLLEALVAHARARGEAHLFGLAWRGNRQMLRLAASLGFRAAPDEDPELLRMELALGRSGSDPDLPVPDLPVTVKRDRENHLSPGQERATLTPLA